jgi:hypothetical protein
MRLQNKKIYQQSIAKAKAGHRARSAVVMHPVGRDVLPYRVRPYPSCPIPGRSSSTITCLITSDIFGKTWLLYYGLHSRH